MTKAGSLILRMSEGKEKLLAELPDISYSYNAQDGSDGKTPVKVDNSKWWDKYNVGDTYVVSAGAPGTGRWVYKITRKTSTGVYGELVSNTVRELDPSEVR